MTQPGYGDVVNAIGTKALAGVGMKPQPKKTAAELLAQVNGTATAASPYATKAGDLKGALKNLQGLMPDADDPGYKADPQLYQDNFASWLSMYLDTTDAYQALQQAAFGYVTLPDGTMLPTGDLTPEQKSIFDQANEAKYQNTLSALGLQQANLVADRAQAGFQNQLTRVDAAMGRDDLRLRQAESKISRNLQGMGESRSRADLIANTKLQAAPYATQGGKSSFSANDMGSLLGEFSAFAGVDPNSSLLNYGGTTMVDPEADMQRFDSLLGVGGALPGIPDSLLSDSEDFAIPGVPDLGPIPQLSASRVVIPSAPAATPAAGNGAASAVGGAVKDLLAKLLGGGSGAASGGGAPSFANPGTFNPATAGQTNQSLLNAASGGWKSRIGGK